MNLIFKKLQYKDQERIVVLNPPDSFLPVLEEMKSEVKVEFEAHGADIPFILGFAEMGGDLTKMIDNFKGKLSTDDPVLWIAYPKKSSNKYKSDIHRDSVHWVALGEMGFEGVRQVAIDEDWSALRFRHIDHIKTMSRDPNRAESKEGKKRTNKEE